MTEDRPESDGGRERPSKSARKRELLALQELVERMAALSDRQLAQLSVDERLRDGIAQLRSMPPSGARNRQLKHCVKFIDPDELAEVTAFLDNQQSSRVAANREFHDLERWRERLVGEGDIALDDYLQENPEVDRQHLRRLCRDAARERDSGKPAGAGKKLFRYLREVKPGN